MKIWKFLALWLALFLLVGKVNSNLEGTEDEENDAEVTESSDNPEADSEENAELGVSIEGLNDEEQDEKKFNNPVLGKEEDLPNAINFENDSESEHMANFKKISEDLKVYQDEYSTCISEIPDDDYTDEKIDACVGKNFIKVVLDIKYETLKVMARADTKIRKYFIHSCYEPAGTIEEFSVGCDFMERDTLDFMWNGLDFVDLLEINKDKYLNEYGKIPREDFKEVTLMLTEFSKQFFELLDEIDSHKEVTIMKLKNHIDDRTKLILEEAKLHPEIPQPSNVSHTIQINERLIQNTDVLDPLTDNGDRLKNRVMKQLPGNEKEDTKNESELRKTKSSNIQQTDISKYHYDHTNLPKRALDSRSKTAEVKNRNYTPTSKYSNLSHRRASSATGRLQPALLNHLTKMMRAQGSIPFKNVHRPEFLKEMHKKAI
jgi:hypothetical protein